MDCGHCENFRRNFVARSFALIALVQPILHWVYCRNKTNPNAPKHYETYRNITLGSNWVDWVCPSRKIPTWLRGTNFCINCTSSPHFTPSLMQLRNDPKCTKIVQMSNGVDWVCSLRKIPTWLRGTNFCTSSAYFAPSFVRQPNGPKCTQIVRNSPKYQFRVQWGGSGVFVAKNSDVTSWHEPLH